MSDPTTPEPTSAPLRHQWARFRTPGRLLALAAAALLIILSGVGAAVVDRRSCSEGPVEVTCPSDPVGPDGLPVSDQFTFLHQPLGEEGSITVRLTAMTGIITHPPPDHDEIVEGLVPWAKAGIIVKEDFEQGSAYAALMLTGRHGVRMQHDFTHDVAGSPGGVSARAPRWLRLTRAGDTISGHESVDGVTWTPVGTVRLSGLAETVQVGMFVTSPGDLTLRRSALGGAIPEGRFTQATAVFDHALVQGEGTVDGWRHRAIGEMGHTDWEQHHQPPGVVESDGTFTVTGSGDIGPVGTNGGRAVEDSLVGLPLALVLVIVVAVRFATSPAATSPETDPSSPARVGAAMAVVGGAAFVTGLVAAGVVLPLGVTLLEANGVTVLAAGPLATVRVILGVATLLGATAVGACALGLMVRRWMAVAIAVSAIVVPYVLSSLPLLPDEVADWLLRLTPAAGFSVLQTVPEYAHVVAHHAPSAGFFPLAWWAGLAVLAAYSSALLMLAVTGSPARRSQAT